MEQISRKRRGRLAELASNRLVHFAVLGGLLFAIAPPVEAPDAIVVDRAAVEAMQGAEARRLGEPRLAPEQAAAVLERAVSDEVLYREAMRLGLDRDDPVVRQRLIQKVLFLAQDLAGLAGPASEEDLREFFEATRDQWTRPPRVKLLHVYAGPAHRHLLPTWKDEAVALEAASPGVPPAIGDAFPVSRRVEASRDDVAGDFSEEFASAAFSQPIGDWGEPVSSKHGWHLVKVLERDAGGAAEFEDVRGKLPIVYLSARTKEVKRDFLHRATARYRIEVRGNAFSTATATAAVAPPRVVDVD